MKLTNEQHAELSRFVAAGDRAKIESLLDAIFLQMRRREQAAMETIKRRQKQAATPWIPER